ncbi:MAG: T9SS type A sorting domain-containing protein [Bacteroidetes bacterium]|nr:T9SS type A sorting domain-containing protein [Bacteroidota bacterium]
MQRRLPVLLALLLSAFATSLSQAQCTDRYLRTIYADVDSTQDVTYTTTAGDSATTLWLDVYQPHGDTATARRLIIWMHGGAFFQGSKADGDMKYLCYRFAQRGYVCATINYRLAPSVISLYDSLQDFKYMVWAMSDMKAAIRYFKKEYSNGNQWKIDTDRIYIGGSSAGAIASDMVAFLDSDSTLPAPFRALLDSNGGINGNSGNPGYSTRPYAVASLAGAINNLGWIHGGSPPTILSQGTADRIVPYDCAYAFAGYTGGFLPTIRMCGSGMMAPQFNTAGVQYGLQSFPGSDHVPWDNDPAIAYSMDSAVATFFYTLDCQLPQGISDVSTTNAIDVYPNPAITELYIRSKNPITQSVLYDMTGRLVASAAPKHYRVSFHVENLPAGIYILQVETKETTFTRKISIQ